MIVLFFPLALMKYISSLLWQQMDNAVYTFEQLLNQSLEDQGDEDLCKTIQKCEDRVLKVRGRGLRRFCWVARQLTNGGGAEAGKYQMYD